MTSRPPAGIQRQPQRSLSGTGTLQRPTTHRSLSQHFQSPGTVAARRNENYVDLTEAVDSNNPRYGGTPRNGSRLKMEVSKPSQSPALVLDSPKPLESLAESLSDPVSRGRHKLHIDEDDPKLHPNAQVLSSVQGLEKTPGQNLMPMPMPRRPGQYSQVLLKPLTVAVGSAVKKEARPKPYTLEVPSIAPHYSPNGHTDFFPWTGDHPEDRFNDHVIRQGYFDKLQHSQNETGSAKATIFPPLKHKTGLQTLSSLFTSVLAHRRNHGLITSPPTFKPPPRVTLTDTKRESWLRDLANPSISLRRLSRTIPHGIRGKVLLEQCLSKKIPTERAVWLAKCVGANEIRAFKRKGATGTFAMGGEAKWIRDWTVFVEQFVESVMGSCGEKEWKPRVSYAVRLSAHLYTEHLLDRDHYMDWLSVSLESCSLAKIPMWILITQVYWKDLLQSRKYGRRLIGALSTHLQTAHESMDRDLLLPLIERIAYLLQALLTSNSESFIIPKIWSERKPALEACLLTKFPQLSDLFVSIDRRNMRLVRSESASDQTPRRHLVQLLDTSLSGTFISSLSKESWQLDLDRSSLVQTILEWSTSSYRPRPIKVYVGARLLRNWSRHGVDVNDAILGFMGSEISTLGRCKPSLYHLVSELTRSGHFSTSRYLQWLIARGGIRGNADLADDGPCASGLLAHIPIHDLPENVERLRRTLLDRASFSVDNERKQLDGELLAIGHIVSSNGNPLNHRDSTRHIYEPNGSNAIRISKLSRAIKSEIGMFIRQMVSQHVTNQQSTSSLEWKTELTKSAITSTEFCALRTILESTEDISILADVLKLVSTSDDCSVLASVTDTLSMHLETFAAIGALTDIFEALLSHPLSQSNDTSAINILLPSLINLARRVPDAEPTAVQLELALAHHNRKTAAEACSPVSDEMVEVLQSTEAEFSDEMEKVLSSGTSMDTPTLNRLFQTVVARMEVSWTKLPRQQYSCSQLLFRLKAFDSNHFDSLMSSWLQTVLTMSEPPNISHVLGPLVSLGCLDLKVLITTVQTYLQQTTSSNASTLAADALSLLFGRSMVSEALLVEDAYRLQLKCLQFQKEEPAAVAFVIRQAVELCSSSANGLLTSLLQTSQFHTFLQRLVVTQFDIANESLIEPLASSNTPEVRRAIRAIVHNLLEPGLRGDSTNLRTTESRIEHTLLLANDLTMPYCQLELQVIFAFESPDWSNEDGTAAACLEAFERAVDSQVTADNRTWISIVPKLGVQVARHISQRAERQFLQLISSIKSSDSSYLDTEHDVDVATRLLFIVDSTSYSLQASRMPQIFLQIVERLNDLWQTISVGDDAAKLAISERWLPLILDFVVVHINSLEISKSASEIRGRMLLCLTSLLLEIQTQRNDNTLLLSRLFDVTILLVDDLPDDVRLHCLRCFKDKITNTSIRYLFGYTSNPMDWLQLSQKGKLMPYPLRRWEILSEPTPNVGENDTSLSITLFQARRL